VTPRAAALGDAVDDADARRLLTAGSVFADRFEITRELGRGGVSVVYAARDRKLGQDVALKLIVPSPAVANQTRERMRREVNAVRRLVHPNIVAAYDFVEDGPYGAVIMELVDGEDLDRRVRRTGPLPPKTRRGLAPRSRRRLRPLIATASCTAT
jgi:serine/threonine protein kinase